MAKSLDQVDAERKVQDGEGKEYSSEDIELAVRMGIQLIQGEGMDMLRKAINESTDPAVVVGQFLAQLMGQMAEQLQEEVGIDPGVFLAKDGWLDEILDYIEGELGYPDEFSDQVYSEVLEIIKAGAMGSEAPNDVMQMGQEEEGDLPDQPAQPNAPEASSPALPSRPGGNV